MMTLDDTYFMKQALIEAGKAAERGEVPVGAVVVCKERIIARAHNLTETLNDVTAMPKCRLSLLLPTYLAEST